jgi:hypothetical protein
MHRHFSKPGQRFTFAHLPRYSTNQIEQVLVCDVKKNHTNKMIEMNHNRLEHIVQLDFSINQNKIVYV